jgi:hypothetical protein
MRRLARPPLLAAAAVALLALPAPALAGHESDPRSANMHTLGHIVEPAVLGGFGGANDDVHTDIAFQGNYAFQGNWDGFNIRDISDPNNPTTVSRTFCDGNQGDVVVYRDILVRSWNTPAGTPGAFGAGTTCDGQAVAPGFEGLHVFDISDLGNPELVASVPLDCGSHTATLAPDQANDRVIVYSNVSSGGSPPNPACDAIDVTEVPLDDPSQARFLRKEPIHGGSLGSNNGCHDLGIILGQVNMAACASGHATNVFDVGANDSPGGSLVNPRFLYTIEEKDAHGNQVGVGGRWHSAGFTWDGEVLILGWEPGGGLQAECMADDPDIKKSFFFYDAQTGDKLGQWTLPHAQSGQENCTLHNYNVVPKRDSSRYILVSGNYQAGTWVTNFSNPSSPKTVAWSDPPPAPVPPGLGDPPIFCTETGGCALTGVWSSHWYNGFIYESNIGEGLNIFFNRRASAGSIDLDRLNPQTQEFSLP